MISQKEKHRLSRFIVRYRLNVINSYRKEFIINHDKPIHKLSPRKTPSDPPVSEISSSNG